MGHLSFIEAEIHSMYVWFCKISFLCPGLSEVIVITTKDVQKMISADPKKLDMKIKLDVEGIQDDSDMGTADALRHIQRKIKVRDFGEQKTQLRQS